MLNFKNIRIIFSVLLVAIASYVLVTHYYLAKAITTNSPKIGFDSTAPSCSDPTLPCVLGLGTTASPIYQNIGSDVHVTGNMGIGINNPLHQLEVNNNGARSGTPVGYFIDTSARDQNTLQDGGTGVPPALPGATALYAKSTNNYGIFGQSDSTVGNTGVVGSGVFGYGKNGYGVVGYSTNTSTTRIFGGVYGYSSTNGAGIIGYATGVNSYGGYFEALGSASTALQVRGKTNLSGSLSAGDTAISGTATIGGNTTIGGSGYPDGNLTIGGTNAKLIVGGASGTITTNSIYLGPGGGGPINEQASNGNYDTVFSRYGGDLALQTFNNSNQLVVKDHGGTTAFRFDTSSGNAYTKGGTWNTSGADVAEYYPSKETLRVGEIVAITANNTLEQINPFSKSTTLVSKATVGSKMIGIVSTAPGSLLGSVTDGSLNEHPENMVQVALTGRVPLIVKTENGNISVGDRIGLSADSGIGSKLTHDGNSVAIALQPFSGNNCLSVANINSISWPKNDPENSSHPCFLLPDGTYIGKIMALTNISWYGDPQTTEKMNNTISSQQKTINSLETKINSLEQRLNALQATH